MLKNQDSSKKVQPCSACYYCRDHQGACVHKDDMAEILQKIIDADVLVLASPVYFYSIDAQLKAVIDRTVARWLEVKNKEFYYIATMADEAISSADRTINCFRGYADCVAGAIEKALLSVTVFMNVVRLRDIKLCNKHMKWVKTYEDYHHETHIFTFSYSNAGTVKRRLRQ